MTKLTFLLKLRMRNLKLILYIFKIFIRETVKNAQLFEFFYFY